MGLFNRIYGKNKNEKIEQEKVETEKIEKKEDFKNSLKVKEKHKKSKKKYSEQEYLKREERVKNYYLKQVAKGFKDDGKMYEEYDGINISQGKHRGEILRIRDLELERIDKKSNSYLYSGYIGNTLEEDEAIDFDYWSMTNHSATMVPVCFELYRELEEIVKKENKKEIEVILEFLSAPQNFIDNNRLKYLGKIEIKPEVNRLGEIVGKLEIKRRAYSKSPFIDEKVDRMQKMYALKQKTDEVR